MHRLLFLLATLLFACGGSAQHADYEPYRSADTATYENVSYLQERGDSDEGDTEEIVSDSTGSVTSSVPSKVDPNTTKKSAAQKTYQPTAEDLEKRLVKNATLRMTVKKESAIPERLEKAEQITKSVDGYVSSKTERSMIARVPNDKLDLVLDQLRELGRVQDEDISVMDVTSRYVDLRIRTENMRRLKTRLQELIAQGQNVKEILEVEKELARVTSQLESLEGQLRLMKNQTTYATVSVYFKKRVRPGPIGWVFYGIYSGVKWLFVWD